MRYLIASVAAVFILLFSATDTLAQGKRPRGHRMREDNAPKLGEVAPGFRLRSLDGKSQVALSQFRGKKPVVLIFGSYT